MKNDKYYYCYSYGLKKFLKDSGMFIVVKGINPNTGKIYWVFERSEMLDKLLSKWSNNRVNN